MGHHGHSEIQTPRPSLRNVHVLLKSIFTLQASDPALCLVSTRRDDLPGNFFLGMGFTNHASCLYYLLPSETQRAVTEKGKTLVGQ